MRDRQQKTVTDFNKPDVALRMLCLFVYNGPFKGAKVKREKFTRKKKSVTFNKVSGFLKKKKNKVSGFD